MKKPRWRCRLPDLVRIRCFPLPPLSLPQEEPGSRMEKFARKIIARKLLTFWRFTPILKGIVLDKKSLF